MCLPPLTLVRDIFFEKFIDLIFGWWAAFCVVFEISGAVTDAEFAGLASVALTDADFFMKFIEESFLFEHIKCRDEISVTCAAGVNFFYCICHFYDFAALWDVLLHVISQYTDIGFGNIGTANTKLTGKLHIWNIRDFVMELLTDVSIYQNRVHCSPDTVHYNRISAIFKIEVSADIVNYDKILMDSSI